MLERYWDYMHNFMVSYVPAEREKGEEQNSEIITGVAKWSRCGRGWQSLWESVPPPSTRGSSNPSSTSSTHSPN